MTARLLALAVLALYLGPGIAAAVLVALATAGALQ